MTLPHHDGATYCAPLDKIRLNTAMGRVYWLMRDGAWRSLSEIAHLADTSEAGASARLRDFRKEKFRAVFGDVVIHSVRQHGGRWVYRMEVKR